MTGLLESVKQFISSMFSSGSSEASEINHLFIIFSILSAVMLAIVAFMVIGGVLLYHADKRKDEPPQTTGNKYLELTWTVIPLGIVVVLFFLSLNIMKQINEPVPIGQKPDILVIAHQWWWDFRYPKDSVIASNELHIPAGKKLLMEIRSADVIHSWWVPELGRKIDAIPGRINNGWIRADTVGEYEGTCSEYCGTQHAWMRIRVIAEDPGHFNEWLRDQRQPAPSPVDSLSKVGQQLFQEKTCGNCHSIRGTPANEHLAPDLTHLASRETLLAGMKKNNEQNLKKWISDPQKIKKGAHMPDFLFSDQEVNALTSYLEQLK